MNPSTLHATHSKTYVFPARNTTPRPALHLQQRLTKDLHRGGCGVRAAVLVLRRARVRPSVATLLHARDDQCAVFVHLLARRHGQRAAVCVPGVRRAGGSDR